MSRRRAIAAAAAAVVLVGFAADPAAAGNGELDSAFATGGVARSGITGDDYTVDAVADPAGTLLHLVQLVTGPAGAKQPAGAALIRYLSNGQVDTTFASSGVLRLPDAMTQPAQLVETTSRLVIVGSSGRPADPTTGTAATPGDVVTVQLAADGTPDAGLRAVTADLGGQGDDQVTAAAADGDSVVITGHRLGGVGTVARLLPGGSLDGAFGSGGVTDLPGAEREGLDVAVDSAHGVVVIAPVDGETSIYRLTSAGAVDAGFAGTGGRRLPLAARRFIELPDGRLVVPGSDTQQPLVHVLSPDGATVTTLEVPATPCHPRLLGGAADVGPDGVTRITSYGVTTSSSCDAHPVVVRLVLGSDGLSPDPGFGENGVIDLTAQQVHATAPTALVSAPDRLLLGAVVADGTDYDGALIALQTTGPAATTVQLSAPGPVTVDWFRPISLSAALTRASGQPVAGRSLSLQRRDPGGDWTNVSSATTDAGGRATLSDQVTRPTADYRVAFTGTDTLAASVSAVVTVTARPVLSAAISTTLLKLGQSVRISGVAGPPSPVMLQESVGGSWTTRATGTPSSNGAYAFTFRPTTAAIHRYRIAKPATAGSPDAVTGQLAVSVYRMQILTIHYNAAGNDVTNPNGEYLTLRNAGASTVSVAGWKLDSGGAGQRFTLPTYSIGPGATVRIYTGRGTNGPGRLYLGRRYGDIWNNNGDTATLFDSKGVIATTYRY